jgi:hypothetical protein
MLDDDSASQRGCLIRALARWVVLRLNDEFPIADESRRRPTAAIGQ